MLRRRSKEAELRKADAKKMRKAAANKKMNKRERKCQEGAKSHYSIVQAKEGDEP